MEDRPMIDYFAEKSTQIDPCKLIAFGIHVHSRYGNAEEIVEMIDFANRAARKCVAHYVKEVFYDSKCGLCNFVLVDAVRDGDAVSDTLYGIAENTIRNFMWLGGIVCEGRVPPASGCQSAVG